MKDWIRFIAFVVLLWVIMNLMTAGMYVLLENEFFGESTFCEIFFNLSILELVAFCGVGILIAAFASLIKTVRKGLREEKKRYENKHRKRNK